MPNELGWQIPSEASRLSRVDSVMGIVVGIGVVFNFGKTGGVRTKVVPGSPMQAFGLAEGGARVLWLLHRQPGRPPPPHQRLASRVGDAG
jgi:hypothetical protein